jgi:non-ribosomal peptide synthase protein (TIGR01720 family)
LGQWDNTLTKESLFKFAGEPTGESVSIENKALYFIDINAEVMQGVLNINCSYSLNHYYPDTIEALAKGFVLNLRRLIEHCCQDSNFGYTPSDFNLTKLSSEDLKRKLKFLLKEGN